MSQETRRLTRAAAATVLAEVLFTRPGGGLGAVTVTPLVADGQVVLALPYAQRELADELGAAEQLALALSDDRMALRDWEPLLVRGRIEVEHDPEGERFSEELLDQELRKHPPSRALLDAPRDRRDHWWYVPRVLCRLVPTGPVRDLTPRSDPTAGLLGWSTSDGLEVETVEITDADETSLQVRPLSARELQGADDPALLFRHDYSQPDLERRSERHEAGRLRGATLVDVVRSGGLVLPGPPRLLDRVRRHRALSRGCRRELARVR